MTIQERNELTSVIHSGLMVKALRKIVRGLVLIGLFALPLLAPLYAAPAAAADNNNIYPPARSLQATPAGIDEMNLSSPGKAKEKSKEIRKEGELIVKFKAGTGASNKLKVHTKHGSTVVKEFKSLRIQHVKLKKGITVEDAIELYKSDPDVEYAEPNYAVSTTVTPNDPNFSSSWGLHNTLYTGAPDIDAPEAWNITTGSSAVVIAVLDTGIDYNHQDLAANRWVNTAEANGIAGVDDDGNGYVDDIYGIDTYNHDTDPKDDHYHGTHVAGIIGAVGNNGLGSAGVNWDVRILACKFIGAGGTGYTSGAIECLQYIKAMKDAGVNIIATNNSWGSVDSFSQALQDAIDAQRDILFIAAAGNEGTDNNKYAFYPANYVLPSVISVASINSSDGKSSFSNYGSRAVHVGAPGENIYSTYPNNGYLSQSGTSMAAPHVAGLAGLIKAQDPARDWRAIKNLILSGGVGTNAMNGKTITGKRINAYGSMTCTNSPVFAVLQLPASLVIGVPHTLSALSINCGLPAGPVSVTLGGGGTVNLLDDGAAPDLAAGDGVFTGTWVPAGSAVETLYFSSPIGNQTVASPPVLISAQVTVAPPATIIADATASGRLGESYVQTFTATGGIAPLTWSLASGSLPYGLTLNISTGEITGSPSTAGVFPFTVQVRDGISMSDTRDWTIVINKGLRAGWPQVLEKRIGYGFLPSSFSPIFADLNDDGADELIVADVNTLYVFDRNGPAGKITLPGKVSTPLVADIDNDGVKEIIVGVGEYYSSANPIYVLRQDLTYKPGFPAGAYPSYNGGPGAVKSVVAADMDNDGNMELIAVCYPNSVNDPNYGTNILVVVDSQGNMVPGWPKVVPGGNWGDFPPSIEDIDQDGYREIVFASYDGIVHIYRGDGTVVNEWSFLQDLTNLWPTVLADLDGDGELEIVTKGQTNASGQRAIVVHAFERTGTLMAGWPRQFSGGCPNGMAAADLDGNGTVEVIFIAGNWCEELQALQSDGASVAGWPVIMNSADRSPSFNSNPIIGDINGDSINEVLVATTNYEGNGKLLAYASSGAVVPGYPKYTTPGNDIRSTATMGDLDNNGRIDLAVKSEDGMLYVWEEDSPSSGQGLEWPMFRHDPLHTGVHARSPGVPDQFSFADQVDVPLDTLIVSNSVVVSGITVSAPIAIVGGEYDLNADGLWRSAPGMVGNGDTVRVRVRSSSDYETTVGATLIVGGVSGKFNVTTLVAPYATGATLTASPTGPQPAGTMVIFQAGVIGGSGPYEYRFWRWDASASDWTMVRDYSMVNTWTWDTTDVAEGYYTVMVHVRLVGSTAAWEVMKAIGYVVDVSTAANMVSIAGGYSHTVAIRTDGTLWAWGFNTSGQLGDGTTMNRPSPVQIARGSTFRAVAAGLYHTVAIRTDGTLWAWGYNWYGQLGDGMTANRLSPVQIAPGSTFVTVAAGYNHTIAVRSDGTLWAWGYNEFGQLGDGTTANSSTPVQIVPGNTFIAVGAGERHSGAIKDDGTLWMWGGNPLGQVGDGTRVNRPLPVQIASGSTFKAVVGGLWHTIAIRTDGALLAWGHNVNGQLGDGTTADRLSPVTVAATGAFSAVTAGRFHTAAIRTDGMLWTWGENNYGQLGDGTTANRKSPVPVLSGHTVIAVAAGYSHTLAIRSDGTLLTWGYNGNYQLGNGTAEAGLRPVRVDSAGSFLDITSFGEHSVAIQSDGSLWAWGYNGYGQIGDGTTTSRQVPVPVAEGSSYSTINAGLYHTLAIRDDSTLWAWGYNSYGQLGDGTKTNKSAPVQIASGSTFSSVAAGYAHTTAVKSDGSLWTWGRNNYGQLGDGSATDSTTPVHIAAGSTFSAVAAGYYHTAAIKTAGSLWAWGYNSYGQLGDGTVSNKSTPVPVAEGSTFIAVAAGSSHTVAIRSDGTLWAWGYNSYGQLGDGTVSNKSAPVQVAPGSTFFAVAAGWNHTLALRSDGTLWAWGSNNYGQVGNGTLVNNSIPVQIAVGDLFAALAAGNSHSIAIRNDGTLWAWGNNSNGQRGDGNAWIVDPSPAIPLGPFPVTPSAGAGGTISPPIAQLVNYGNTVSFLIQPDAGNSIGSVTGCGGSLAGAIYTTGPVTAVCPVTATFVPTTWPLALTVAGAGTVHTSPGPDLNCAGSCGASYAENTIVTLTAVPDTGYTFTTWSGDCSGTDPVSTVTMDAARTCTATFDLLIPVASVALSANPAGPQTTGTPVTFTAVATGGSGTYEYQFLYKLSTDSSLTLGQDYSPTGTWTWSTGSLTAGSYIIQVRVRNAGSKAFYEALKTIGYTLQTSPATGATLTAGPVSPQSVGTAVTFTAGGIGGSGSYEYQFLYKQSTDSSLTLGQDYSPTGTWTWPTGGMTAGSYHIQARVRSAGSTAIYEAIKTIGYTLQTSPATGATLSVSPASPRTVGTAVTFTAGGNGGSGSYEYQFLYKQSTDSSLTLGQDYSPTGTWTWSTGSLTAGRYFIQVRVRNAGSTAYYEALKTIGYTLQ